MVAFSSPPRDNAPRPAGFSRRSQSLFRSDIPHRLPPLQWPAARLVRRPAGHTDELSRGAAREPGMSLDIADLFAEREAERYALHARYLHAQMVRVPRT